MSRFTFCLLALFACTVGAYAQDPSKDQSNKGSEYEEVTVYYAVVVGDGTAGGYDREIEIGGPYDDEDEASTRCKQWDLEHKDKTLRLTKSVKRTVRARINRSSRTKKENPSDEPSPTTGPKDGTVVMPASKSVVPGFLKNGASDPRRVVKQGTGPDSSAGGSQTGGETARGQAYRPPADPKSPFVFGSPSANSGYTFGANPVKPWINLRNDDLSKLVSSGVNSGTIRKGTTPSPAESKEKIARQHAALVNKANQLGRFRESINKRQSELTRWQAAQHGERQRLSETLSKIRYAQSLLNRVQAELSDLLDQDPPSITSPAYSDRINRISDLRVYIRESGATVDRANEAYNQAVQNFNDRNAAIGAEDSQIEKLRGDYRAQCAAYEREVESYKATFQANLKRRDPSGEHAK